MSSRTWSQFNRYNRNVQLRLEDVPPRSYQYDGVFDAADPQYFVGLLAKEPGLTIERNGGEVIVRARKP